MNEEKEWFESWFDTKWYHILYKNRDYEEAERFLKNLMDFLNLEKDSLLLDAACGAGRHSKFLNTLGYEVHGFDLSANSIAQAKTLENDKLHFSVQDLRTFRLERKFDGIFSFFTSFGYFKTQEESQAVIDNFSRHLDSNGVLVLDFMNADKVINSLVHEEEKEVDGISFHINRRVENQKIIKRIAFEAEGNSYQFEEKVSAFSIEDFKTMLSQSGLEIKHTFGDYDLNTFAQLSSPRLILVACKAK